MTLGCRAPTQRAECTRDHEEDVPHLDAVHHLALHPVVGNDRRHCAVGLQEAIGMSSLGIMVVCPISAQNSPLAAELLHLVDKRVFVAAAAGRGGTDPEAQPTPRLGVVL